VYAIAPFIQSSVRRMLVILVIFCFIIYKGYINKNYSFTNLHSKASFNKLCFNSSKSFSFLSYSFFRDLFFSNTLSKYVTISFCFGSGGSGIKTSLSFQDDNSLKVVQEPKSFNSLTELNKK
jgi:hypothetical protein